MGDSQQNAPTSRNGQSRDKKPPFRWLRRAVYLLVALGALALVVFAYRPQPLSVDLAPVERGNLEITLREEGKTRIKERYVVSAPITSQLLRSELHAGDDVNAGQTIARLLPVRAPLLDERSAAQAAARVAAARAGKAQAAALVERLSTEVGFAERDATRKRGLSEQGAVSDSAVEMVTLKLESLRKQLRSAEFGVQVAAHELQLAQAALGPQRHGADSAQRPLELTAPVAGRVLLIHQQSQSTVAAGSPLVSLGDCRGLEVVVDVLTADAVALAPNARARLSHWGGDTQLAAHVVRVEPSAFTRVSSLGIEEQRVRVLLQIDSPYEEWRALGDGFRVEVELVLRHLSDVVRVPLGAVFRSGEGWAVYRVEQGLARLTSLRIGQRNDEWVEVQSGIKPDAQVVLYPSDRLSDGQKVVARR